MYVQANPNGASGASADIETRIPGAQASGISALVLSAQPVERWLG